MTINKRQRVAIYVRVSTHNQTPDLQLRELHQLARQRGWQDTREYIDIGQSGAKQSRPALDEMMSDVMKGRIDIVVCWRFDRFARSVKQLVTALEEFQALGVDFLSLNDGIDTSTPTGRFTFHIISAMAELEREIIRERVVAGLAAARARGANLGRPKADLDMDEVQELHASGLSMRKIATRFGVGVSTISRAMARVNSTVVLSSSGGCSKR